MNEELSTFEEDILYLKTKLHRDSISQEVLDVYALKIADRVLRGRETVSQARVKELKNIRNAYGLS
jgi:hypothetical protein